MEIKRLLKKPEESFFLFGPRGVGKSTWLRLNFPNEIRFDLLDPNHFLAFSRDPTLLAAKIGHQKKGTWVLIDEIQKLPILLDEVHRLIEEKEYRFVLTGSSARKLKRSGANLLAGRAITRTMSQMTSQEWLKKFNYLDAINWGGLPLAIKSSNSQDFLQAYFFTYLKEEIQEEGLVRQIDPFVRFLEVMAIYNGQVLNVENLSRESGIKRVTLDNWISILEDTLVGFRLPAWQPKLKVREVKHPKFYWFDPGVARAAAGLLNDPLQDSWMGWMLESWIMHEVRSHNSYANKQRGLFYYNTSGDREIDLIIETQKGLLGAKAEIVAIEIKLSSRWKREWESVIRDMKSSPSVVVKKMIGIYTGKEILEYDEFKVYPVTAFCNDLHRGKIF